MSFLVPCMVVALVDAVSVTPLYEHPIPFLILELPYAQLLEVPICVWSLYFHAGKAFLNKPSSNEFGRKPLGWRRQSDVVAL